jgi:MaoC like domain
MPVTLDSMPSLGSLYRRALVQALRASGPWQAGPGPARAVSSEPVCVRGVRLAPDRLAAYRSVCGFAPEVRAPATYPQALAFPLQLRVLTSPEFPFAAMGAVHIANSIVQDEHLSVGDTLDLAVHATNLRSHPRGRQVTIVTEARVADRAVWRSHSDYLRVERPDRTDRASGGAAGDAGETRGATVAWELAADLGRRYAAVTGDRNPIHLYDLTARPFGFRRHIAHGMWTLARCLAQLGPQVPARMRCDVGFRRPVPLPGRVEFTVSEATDGRLDFSVGSASSPDRHLRGTLEAH